MATENVTANAGTTQCRACERHLPPSEFYVSNKSKCRECVCAAVTKRRRENPAVQAYDRERAKQPHRKDNTHRVVKAWREKASGASAAHSAVARALRQGVLERGPCLFCGSEHVHAHHRDYAKPLEVVWLCAQCHRRLHAVFPETDAAKPSHHGDPA